MFIFSKFNSLTFYVVAFALINLDLVVEQGFLVVRDAYSLFWSSARPFILGKLKICVICKFFVLFPMHI